MVFKTKIKCPVCEGDAKLSKTSLQMFGGLVTLKDNPIYECKSCKEKFATGKMVDVTVEKARKEFSFARKLISTGGSLAITIPPDLTKFYKLKKGEDIQLIPAG
ncbi:MAG: hypothetical protein Q8N60_01210, partial [Candidatus Diapherotrites archaeon]|nr:hypothetical protein [Candidatus Diapherotrites archaeon]